MNCEMKTYYLATIQSIDNYGNVQLSNVSFHITGPLRLTDIQAVFKRHSTMEIKGSAKLDPDKMAILNLIELADEA